MKRMTHLTNCCFSRFIESGDTSVSSLLLPGEIESPVDNVSTQFEMMVGMGYNCSFVVLRVLGNTPVRIRTDEGFKSVECLPIIISGDCVFDYFYTGKVYQLYEYIYELVGINDTLRVDISVSKLFDEDGGALPVTNEFFFKNFIGGDY